MAVCVRVHHSRSLFSPGSLVRGSDYAKVPCVYQLHFAETATQLDGGVEEKFQTILGWEGGILKC